MTALHRMALLSIAASLATMGLKFWAFYLSDAVSLYSDAAESSVNLVAGLVALAAVSIASRPADSSHSYGHDKAEYFSSGVEGGLILVAAGTIIYAAVHRFLRPAELMDLGPALLIAVAASGVNLVVARVMLRVARHYDSITIEADAHHLMTDVWTSAGVVAGLTVVLFAPPGLAILDPIIAVVVALNIIRTGAMLLRRSAAGLMDAALPEPEQALIEQAIVRGAGENAVYHGLRTRKSGPRRFVDLHLLVSGATTVKQAHDLCNKVEREIRASLANAEITIHVEPREDSSSWDYPEGGATREPADIGKGT